MSIQTLTSKPATTATIAAASVAVAVVAAKPYVFKEFVLSLGTLSGLYSRPIPKDAMEPCPKGSINCLRTTWIPKKPVTHKDAINAVRECLNTYPQEGQDGIDKGGWKIVEDNFEKGGSTWVEFSSGIGKYAKMLNGGKPFIGDLLLKVELDGSVEIRSSSRKGMGDFGVNQKRVAYLVKNMSSSWATPEPKYNN